MQMFRAVALLRTFKHGFLYRKYNGEGYIWPYKLLKPLHIKKHYNKSKRHFLYLPPFW